LRVKTFITDLTTHFSEEQTGDKRDHL